MPSIGLGLSLTATRKVGGGTPPPPPFSPTDLASLLVWLNSSNTESITVDGSNQLVTQMDLSGNGVNWVPTVGAVAPTLVPDIFNGVALLKLNDTDSLQTLINPMSFDPGFGYNGPMVTAYVARFSLPGSSGLTIPALTVDGDGAKVVAAETGDSSSFKGVVKISTDLTGVNFGFLSEAWPGPITPPNPADVYVAIISFKGSTRNQGMAYFFTLASGSVPNYFASLPLTPFTHGLFGFGSGKNLFMGLGQAGTEMYIREWFVSVEDSPTVTLASVRDYLLSGFQTMRPVYMVQGDSLAGGFGIGQSLAWPYRFSLQLTGQDVLNFGINSRTLALLAADQPAYVSLIRPRTGYNRVCIDAGTNDIYNGATAATTLARLLTLAALWKAQGFIVDVLDVIPRNFGAPLAGNPQDAAKEAERVAYNAMLSTLSDPSVDNVVMLTDHAPFNNVNAWSNETYYNADQIHLVALGYQTKANIVFAVLFGE